MTDTNTKSSNVVLWLLATIVCVLLGAVIVYSNHLFNQYFIGGSSIDDELLQVDISDRQVALRTINELYAAGDFDSVISLFKERDRSRDNEFEAVIDSFVAQSLYARNQGNDRIDAVNLYKNMALNSDLLPETRSEALSDLAFLLQVSLAHLPEDFLETVVFTDTFALYTTSTEDLKQIRDLYAASSDFKENAFAEFGLLAYYTRSFFTTGQIDEFAATNQMRALLQKATDLLALQFDNYSPRQVGDMYLTKAFALAVINRIDSNVPVQEVERAFRDAVEVTSRDVGGRGKEQEFINRLMYAMYLSNTFGADRNADILTIVTPLNDVDLNEYPMFLELVDTAVNAPDGDFFGDSLRLLLAQPGVAQLVHF